MSRGTNLAEGLTITEQGRNGVLAKFHFRGDTLVIERSQDLEPILEHVAQMRARNEGRKFASEVKELGHIPALFYGKICMILDRDERQRAVREFFRENPVFCAYAPLLTNRGGTVH